MAEGILEPQESLKLNFNQSCVQSPLLHRLWACAVLCCLTGQCLAQISQGFLHPLSCCAQRNSLTLCPAPLLSQPLLVPFREAAPAVGDVGGGSKHLWLEEELEFEKIMCTISSVALTLWFLLLFPESLGDSSEADAAVGISGTEISVHNV